MRRAFASGRKLGPAGAWLFLLSASRLHPLILASLFQHTGRRMVSRPCSRLLWPILGTRPFPFSPKCRPLMSQRLKPRRLNSASSRKHTAAWADTSLPLNYIGKHVTVLRGPNLLSYWALKTFGDNRLPCPHSKATAWRGFFKVADCWTTSLSSQVLLASFSHPKVLITRPTPASFLCPWPLAHWRMHGSALLIVSISPGVALSGDKFAIRCKREHADQVSLHLMPHTLIALLLTQASWFGLLLSLSGRPRALH